MTVVVDASTVVAALIEPGPVGAWAESMLLSGTPVAPHLMPVEAASVLRRGVLAGEVTADVASLAHADLTSLRLELFPYAPFAARVWELRSTVTAYDAWYVALAEGLDAAMATLDARLSRATGPRCAFLTPPG